MTAIVALVSGGAGGLGGTLLAQTAVSLAHRAGLGSQTLQGKWGPPFFDVAMFIGVLYGVIAAALSRRWRKTLLGTAAPSLGIIVPLFILERTARMGWGTDAEYSGGVWTLLQSPWYAAVLGVYACSLWGTIAWLGRTLTGRWRGALSAVAGGFAAVLIMAALRRADPGLDSWSWRASEFLPQLSALLDGMLTGAGLGLGIWTVKKGEKGVSDVHSLS